jgi:hypothetical protein
MTRLYLFTSRSLHGIASANGLVGFISTNPAYEKQLWYKVKPHFFTLNQETGIEEITQNTLVMCKSSSHASKDILLYPTLIKDIKEKVFFKRPQKTAIKINTRTFTLDEEEFYTGVVEPTTKHVYKDSLENTIKTTTMAIKRAENMTDLIPHSQTPGKSIDDIFLVHHKDETAVVNIILSINHPKTLKIIS